MKRLLSVALMVLVSFGRDGLAVSTQLTPNPTLNLVVR